MIGVSRKPSLSNSALMARTRPSIMSLGATMSAPAAYHHPPGHYVNGRIHFDVTTNPMPLAQIGILLAAYPTVRGTLQASGSGDIDLSPDAQIGRASWRE